MGSSYGAKIYWVNRCATNGFAPMEQIFGIRNL